MDNVSISKFPPASNKRINQANLLKIAAVTIAIPRYAGAFALSAGFIATGTMHTGLGIAEVVAGISMAVLEGFAIAFVLNKWRLLKPNTLAWWSLLIVCLSLALSLPLVAIPYLFLMQQGYSSVTQLFPNVLVQNIWNFVVAFVPMLVVIGVGLADVNELEREEKLVDFELEKARKQAQLEQELSNIELQTERAKLANRLEMEKLRASHKVGLSNVETQTEQRISKPFVCPDCGVAYEQERQLRGHKAHCKGRVNGKQVEQAAVTL